MLEASEGDALLLMEGKESFILLCFDGEGSEIELLSVKRAGANVASHRNVVRLEQNHVEGTDRAASGNRCGTGKVKAGLRQSWCPQVRVATPSSCTCSTSASGTERSRARVFAGWLARRGTYTEHPTGSPQS